MSCEVSVIIPTYNRAQFVERAVRSVLAQTYEDFELLVIDDGSSDQTQNTIKRIPDRRIKYIRHSNNKGVSAARNTGIKHAEGNFIALLDDDDVWLPTKLEQQMKYFQTRPDAGAVYTGCISIDSKSNEPMRNIFPNAVQFKDLLRDNYCEGAPSSILIKKDCFKKVGLFDETLPFCEDWDMWIRLARFYEVNVLDQLLVKRYEHASCMHKNFDLAIEGREMLLTKISDDSLWDKKLMSSHRVAIGSLHCYNGNMGEGRRSFREAMKNNPISMKPYILYCSALLGCRNFNRIMGIKDSLRRKFPFIMA
jgi:glycosyltransferase involved in cell wall biosynthesis